MDILYLLIPLSVVLVFFILGGLWWAINRGQFEDIEAEGERILKRFLINIKNFQQALTLINPIDRFGVDTSH